MVFPIWWTAGSKITIAGTEYTIATVQSELVITLVSGPGGDLSNAVWSGNNFGVMLWKKTGTANTISLGFTQYNYGSSPTPTWGPATSNPCGPPVTVSGVIGYDCFNGQELFFFSADGSITRDLGLVQTWFGGGGSGDPWGTGFACGDSENVWQFDPAVDDTWYCTLQLFGDPTRFGFVIAHYNGTHNSQPPGVPLQDCSLNGGTQPCVDMTLMMPTQPTEIEVTGPAFNPDFTASGFVPVFYQQSGVSADGKIIVWVRHFGSNSPAWTFVYDLGDRTPSGTTANSLHIIASASSYRKPPATWCAIHNIEDRPEGGWAGISNQEFAAGGQGSYVMTMTSATLNTTPGVAGGLNTCPANIFGVSGAVCTAVTVTGQPISVIDSSVLQNLQVGDLLTAGSGGTLEYIRVITIASGTSFTVQRGYMPDNPPAINASTTLSVSCGTRNQLYQNDYTLWNYMADPLGSNSNLGTVTTDPTQLGGHHFVSGGVYVATGGFPFNLGTTICPTSASTCAQTRNGTLSSAQFAVNSAVSQNAQFAGITGMGQGNEVDSHPGPCFNFVCTDARPLLGAPDSGLGPTTLGTVGSPFVNTTGQLWKITGANSVMDRKHLPTVAYVGRTTLVDVSGPASTLGSTGADSYKYCYAWAVNECVTGSAVGDVYVNAPFVGTAYCFYPGVAFYADDYNPICIGSQGPQTGNVVEFNTQHFDPTGQYGRRIGTNYARWNMMDVFWSMRLIPSGLSAATQVRWFDNARTDNLNNVIPPMPTVDPYTPRNTFTAVPVFLTPPGGMSIASAEIEFGYAENGAAGNYYCTSRQEACVAVTAAVNMSTPYFFESTDTFSPLACVTSCTISIPALPGHLVYYRYKFLNGGGGLVQTGPAQVAVIP